MAKVIDNAVELMELSRASAYTITGAGGDLNDWKEGYREWMQTDSIVHSDTELPWFTWTGALMNETFGLKGSNAYQDDLVFLAFRYDNAPVNVGRLAMFKMMHQDRWLDDIIDNDLRRVVDSVD